MISNPRIISVHSGKGGVGKTTMVANIGSALARRGHSTLLIDSDFYTRGLTFLLTKNSSNSNTSYLEVLKLTSSDSNKSENSELKDDPSEFATLSNIYAVRKNLYLLPPTTHRKVLPSRQIQKFFGKIEDGPSFMSLRQGIRAVFSEFDFIIFDCRSGTDFPSILPALISDEFIIITEEDNTSIRATTFLIEAIHTTFDEINNDLLNKDSEFLPPEPNLAGFIVSMTVSARPDVTVDSLERIFSARCLGVTPLDRRARQAFTNDKLIVEAAPRNPVSQEIAIIANMIYKTVLRSAAARIRSNRRARLWSNSFLFMIVALTPITAIYILEKESYSFLVMSEEIFHNFDPILISSAAVIGVLVGFLLSILRRS